MYASLPSCLPACLPWSCVCVQYNMGECRGQAMAPLSTWIPLGMSLYVSGTPTLTHS